MNRLMRIFLCAASLLMAFAAPVQAQAVPKVLVVYDAPPGTEFEKLGMGYGIMLKNLMGHFNAQTDLLPVHQYTAGKMAGYDATFYMGAYYDNQLPPAFLGDAMATQKTMVWFKYNLWQLAWNAAYNFQANKGFGFNGLRGLNAAPSSSNPRPGFFDTVSYKSLNFVKYYEYDAARNVVAADPDIGVTGITDPARAQAVVTVSNPKTGEAAPYIVRSGNFWYVADMPFSYIGPRDRYIVMTDILHDMLGINHAQNHRAMIRLEDVGALVSVDAMTKLSDHLHAKKIPFSVAAIPYYVDSLGAYNGGVPQYVPLSRATNLRRSLDHAVSRGGEIVMHGYTHQYGKQKNPHTGVSGDDYEFWDIVANTPVPEDSVQWVSNRLQSGLNDLRNHGYNVVAWEAPHYHASAITSKTAAGMFPTTYQRVVYFTADKPNLAGTRSKDFAVGQIFPYLIHKDHYGQRVLPESIGNIEYDIRHIDPTSYYNYTWQDIVTNAQYGKVVRDGFASFFFHPFWLEPELGVPGFEDFKKALDGITQLGYTWVAPSAVKN
ncbi:DUF2334 domain-containing protein [Ramlibacter sp.]|uniref:DUF2334 domain-containing protein n=1 Tax=Ramlibacter sp. TaxID=1917967 RepID=UPI003D0CA7DD